MPTAVSPQSKSKYSWDLYRDGITQGALGLFLTCREQFRLRYMEGWVRKVSSEALEFGSMFHALLEAFAALKIPPNATQEQVHAVQLQSVEYTVTNLRKKLRKTASLTEAERTTQQRLVGMADILGRGYVPAWVKEDYRRKWVAREDTFAVPVTIACPYPYDLVERAIILRGRWDGVFASTENRNSLLETKTKANIDEEGLQESLPFDLQTMLYCFTSEKVHGKPIHEIIYDVIRRPGQRWAKGDTMDLFLQRVEDDVRSRPEHYYKRWRVVLSNGDVDRWFKHQLTPILLQLCLWYDSITSPEFRDNPWKSPYHFLNPHGLFSKWGRCDYFHLITRKENFALRKLGPGEPFPELVD